MERTWRWRWLCTGPKDGTAAHATSAIHVEPIEPVQFAITSTQCETLSIRLVVVECNTLLRFTQAQLSAFSDRVRAFLVNANAVDPTQLIANAALRIVEAAFVVAAGTRRVRWDH